MSLLTNALKIAHGVTKKLELQTTVTFRRYLSATGYGDENYGSPVTLNAVLEYKGKPVRTATGELAHSAATLTFLDLPALVAATPAAAGGGKAGWVFQKDQITLANGAKPPIVDVGGFVDGGGGNLIPTEVYLG